MANHASAKKRNRQTKKRTARNRVQRTKVRNLVKAVRVAIEEENKSDAKVALESAIKRIDRGVSKGLFHRKAGARYISRLTRQVAAL